MEPVEKARDGARRAAKELEESARELAQKVRTYVPLRGDETTRAETAPKGKAPQEGLEQTAKATERSAQKADPSGGIAQSKDPRGRTPSGE